MKLLPIALPGLLVTGLLVVSCVPSVDEEDPETPDGSTGQDASGGSGSGGFSSSSGGASTASGGVTSSGGAVGSGGASSSASASGGSSGSGGLAIGSGGTTGAAGRGAFPTGGRSGVAGRSGSGGSSGAAGRSGSGGSSGAAGRSGSGGRAGTAGGSGTATGTFAQVAQILGTSCGVTSCHSDMTHTNLRNDAGLYARLVNASPAGSATMAACKTMKLVTPNSPSTSVLSQIVKAAVTGCSPARMPDMCSTNGVPRACLSQTQISTIDGWITAGAPM